MPVVRIAIAIAVCVGCSGDLPDTPGGPCWDGTGGEPGGAVEVGTGIGQFEPITQGQTIEVEPGFQGNHHVVVNARIVDLDPGDPALETAKRPRTRIVVLDSSGAELDAIACPYSLAYEDKGNGFELPTGRLVVLLDEVIPTLEGEAITIAVDVIDNDGRVASSSVDVVADVIEPMP